MSHSIIKTIPQLFLWQVTTVLVGFATQILLARALGPHDKGIIDLFLLIPFLLASLADVGLLSANTYFAGKGTVAVKTLHANSLAWSLSVGTILLVAAVVTGLVAGSPFEMLTPGYFLLGVAATIPSVYFSLWSGLLYGSDRVKTVYVVTALTSLIQLAVYAAAIFLSRSLEELLFLSAFLLLLRGGIAYTAFHRVHPLHGTPDLSALKQSLQYGLALYVSMAVNTLHFRVDQFVVSSILGATELGYYALAVRIAELIWLLDYVIINASIFRITSSDLQESVRLTQRMTRVIGLTVFSGLLLLGLISPFAIPLIFGERFGPAVKPLLLLLPGILGWSLARSLSQFIVYQVGKPWYATGAAAISFLVNIGLNFVFIPLWGVEGAAAASAVSYTVCFAILLSIFVRESKSGAWNVLIPKRDDFVLLRTMIVDGLQQVGWVKG